MNHALTAAEIKAMYDAGSGVAPDFTFTLYQGEEALSVSTSTIRLSDLRGKPLVLNFWAGRVPPSRAEMPEIQAFYDEFGGQINVVGLDVGPFTGLGSNEDARNLLRELSVNYPAGFTPDEGILAKYEILSMPTTIFFHRRGEDLSKVERTPKKEHISRDCKRDDGLRHPRWAHAGPASCQQPAGDNISCRYHGRCGPTVSLRR